MVAVDLGLRTLIYSDFHNCHLVFHSDNQGVVGALKASRSHNSAQNKVLRRIIANFRDYKIWLSVNWVKSGDNISDSISWGILPSSITCYDRPPPLPSYLKHFVALV